MTEDFDKLKAQKDALIAKKNAPIRDALSGLMKAYERIVRSNAGLSPDALEKMEPWRCGEYIAAENALKSIDAAPMDFAAVDLDPPPGSSRK